MTYYLLGIVTGLYLAHLGRGAVGAIREAFTPKPRRKADPGRIWKLERELLDRD